MSRQIIIAETVAYSSTFAPGSNFGAEYQGIISHKSAAALCGMYPMPKVGYETCVAFAPKHYGARLYVANVAGIYVLRSADSKVANWPDVFGVTLTRKTV